ncbi:MAG TPA: type IV pilus biogenesis/stability protein PilW [Steroidobacteraceae bacterium]|nr:type IV pilus biogenesis/stability protein PilW [Steroidobacteraceae bacterium]
MRAATIVSIGLVVLGGCTSTNNVTKPQPQRAAEINLELGVEHLRKGNLQEAKDKIDRALEQNPRYGRAHLVAGMLYNRLGDESKAESHYARAVSLEPDNAEFKNNYAVYLCQQKKYDRGRKMALEAAGNALYKTPEVAYLNAGNCSRSAGDTKAAEENYRKALAVKPRFGEALFQMADLAYRQTEYMSARAFLERYLEVGRTSPATLWLGVRIERGLGNHAQAQHYARRLKSEYPSAAQTKELLESERNPG